MKVAEFRKLIREEIRKVLKEAKKQETDIQITGQQSIEFEGELYTVEDIINDQRIQKKIMHQPVKYKNETWYVDGIEAGNPDGMGYRTREYDEGPAVHLTKDDPNNVDTTAKSSPEFDKMNAAIENQLQKFGPPYSDFKKTSRQSNTANYTNFYGYRVDVNGKDYYITYSLNDKLSNLNCLSIRDGGSNTVARCIDLKALKQVINKVSKK